MPLFTIFSASRQTPKGLPTEFALKRDDWNDYGFYTQYQLYVAFQAEVRFIGTVKILRSGQKTGTGPLIEDDFDQLGKDWVSVGDSLDYYQRINELPKDCLLYTSDAADE